MDAKRRKLDSEMSAMAILKVAAGHAKVEPLIEFLVTTEKTLTPAESEESWHIVASRQGRPNECPRVIAVEHKRAAVRDRFVCHPAPRPPSADAVNRFARLVAAVSRQTTMSSYEDKFQDMRLRMMLPVVSTVFAIGFAPYRAAATFWGPETNSMIRPMVTTPLKDILATPPPDGTDGDDAWFCAAIVVLKELTNGLPVVRVGPCMAAAKPSDVPSIAIDRGCFEFDGCARGVVARDSFTPAAHTLCAWLSAAASVPAVAPIAALVFNGSSGGPIDRFLA